MYPVITVLAESRVPTLGAISSQRHHRMHVRSRVQTARARTLRRVPEVLVGGDPWLAGRPERGPRGVLVRLGAPLPQAVRPCSECCSAPSLGAFARPQA